MRIAIAIAALLVSTAALAAQPAGSTIPTGSYSYTQNSTDPNRVDGRVTITDSSTNGEFDVCIEFKNDDGSWSGVEECQRMKVVSGGGSQNGFYVPVNPDGDGFFDWIGTDTTVGPGISAVTSSTEGSGTVSRG